MRHIHRNTARYLASDLAGCGRKPGEHPEGVDRATREAVASLGVGHPGGTAVTRRLSLAGLLLAATLAPVAASAQATSVRDGLVGAWSFVSVVSQSDDGRRAEPFGATPRGIIIFSPDGRFSLFQASANVPPLAANDRAQATPEEARAVVRESIAYFGSYTVNEAAREFSLTLEGSTYANLMGPNPQRRIITKLTPTELAFSNPRTPSGVTLHTVWRRTAPQ